MEENIIYSYVPLEGYWRIVGYEETITDEFISSLSDEELYRHIENIIGQPPTYRILYSMRNPLEKL